ncbi:hypothetical protein N7466_009805 [Penicillium verhagenii]|uniref:uncharacterized protein n=1 Tax=Penicillium verhagenii TaxID=1562060 RepID=UPI00254540E7|nr:uncharacterized protein N7466_009805 [Penicillium verhagenii]KAJ5921479.1 hypothetical protein N7466_009805 [Penicillium verhagenii]
MSTLSPVLLVLGAGPNVGAAVAKAFAAKGYKVALASRKAKEEESSQDELYISCDLSDPTSISAVFTKVKETLGVPSVVVYNAAAASRADLQDPLSMPLAEFNQELSINTTSVFAAAQQAAKGFAELPAEASKTFIFTGNILNTKVFPPLLSLGVGKAATAHLIEYLAGAYPFNGYKFYYADQRKIDGSPIYVGIDGEAHGEFYVGLAELKSQGHWHQTFVKDVGYHRF